MRGRPAIALLALALALAACGETADRDDGGSVTPTEVESGVAAEQPIVIELRLDIPTGEVLPASQLGEAPFCPGGTTFDEHGGTGDLGLVVTTIDCSDGELTITFSPTQDSLIQSSTWRVVEGSGTGVFEGLQGGGEMTVEFEEANPDHGLAHFTGTVSQ